MRVTSYTETIKPHIEKCIIIIKNVHHYEKKPHTAVKKIHQTMNVRQAMEGYITEKVHHVLKRTYTKKLETSSEKCSWHD